MVHVIGANERLMDESLRTLRLFMLMTLAFTWLDFGNGLLMLRRQTRVMLVSQTANMTMTVLMLIALIALTPGWNGMVGALAQSLGTVAELTVVAIAVRRTRDEAPFAAAR
jgi:hypothetical protein